MPASCAAAFRRFDTMLSVNCSPGIRSKSHTFGLYSSRYSVSFFISGFDSSVKRSLRPLPCRTRISERDTLMSSGFSASNSLMRSPAEYSTENMHQKRRSVTTAESIALTSSLLSTSGSVFSRLARLTA